MIGQDGLTIIAVVRQRQVESLRAALRGLGADGEEFPFSRLKSLHFARFLLLDDPSQNEDPTRAGDSDVRLIFLADFDGRKETFLKTLIAAAKPQLDAVYRHCLEYPSSASPENVAAYLREREVSPAARYVNTVGRTVEEIHQESDLRSAIEQYLTANRAALQAHAPLQVRERIIHYVASDPNLMWALEPARDQPLAWRVRQQLLVVAAALAGLIVAVPLSPLLIIGALQLQWQERSDPPLADPASPGKIRLLASYEDHGAQNQFSAVGRLKPGWLRRFTATMVLRAVSFGAAHVFYRSNLAGVKTIHFARWIFLDGKRRVLFASNYDGSLESYMGDFIDKVYWGLNAVFSNGIGYPRTDWLLFRGARIEESFKTFIRARQIPTQVWYSAYPDLTALNIENNARIRAGLSGKMNELQARAWLRRF